MIHPTPSSRVPPAAAACAAACVPSAKVTTTCVKLFKAESLRVHHALEFFGYVTRYKKREDGTPFIGIKSVDDPVSELFTTLLPPSIKPSYGGLYFDFNPKSGTCLKFGTLEHDDLSDLIEDPTFESGEFSFFNASRYGDLAYLKFSGSFEFPKLTYRDDPKIFLFDTRFLRKNPRISTAGISAHFPFESLPIEGSLANQLSSDPFTLSDLDLLGHALFINQASIHEKLSSIPPNTIHSITLAQNIHLFLSHLEEGQRELYLNSRE